MRKNGILFLFPASLVFIKILREIVWRFQKIGLSLHRNRTKAQMAESVDALVSNTSGVKSIPVRPRVWVQHKNTA